MLFCCENNAHVKVSFNKSSEFVNQGLRVGHDDAYFNYTRKKNHLMNLSVPWRGARERHPILVQMFIKVLCKLLDVKVYTGGFIIFNSTFFIW